MFSLKKNPNENCVIGCKMEETLDFILENDELDNLMSCLLISVLFTRKKI